MFDPPEDLPERAKRWVATVGPVVAVDDGSAGPKAQSVLRAMEAAGVHVLVNRQNSGIAHTLNAGIKWSMQEWRPQWILILDQDSDLEPGFITRALAAYQDFAKAEQVGMLCAETLNGEPIPTQQRHGGILEPLDPISSGTLLKTEMLDEIGLLKESLFIDGVDSELNARAREHGWVLLLVPGNDLHHELGQAIPIIFFGRPVRVAGKNRHVQYHPPFRAYYSARNSIFLAKRYGLKQPVWWARKAARNLETDGLRLVLGPYRVKHLQAMTKGVFDGWMGRLGRASSELMEEVAVRPLIETPPGKEEEIPGAEKSDPVVEILLSTWNGAAYLRELLDSLLGQSLASRIRVLIRDDGSTDSTKSILQEYGHDHPNIRVIYGDNIGVKKSYHELLAAADSEANFFMFCDQDDVWMPEKVEVALDSLTSSSRQARPLLYCSRSMVTDAQLNPLGPTDDHRSTSFQHAMVQNIAPGHTMAFNRSLLIELVNHYDAEAMIMYDHWAYLVAAGLGTVQLDHGWHTLYRSHGDNAIGYHVGTWQRIKDKIGVILDHDFGQYVRQCSSFRVHFLHRLSAHDQALINGFVKQGGLFSRLRYVIHFGIRHSTFSTSLVADLLFLFGRYR